LKEKKKTQRDKLRNQLWGESAMESEKKKEGQPEMAVPQESIVVMRLG
jgi:hypothetical protein